MLLFWVKYKIIVDVFEKFLRAYIEKFAYQSIDSYQWKQFLFEYFEEKKALLDQVDFDAWFFGFGMPPVQPRLVFLAISPTHALLFLALSLKESFTERIGQN